MITTRTEPARQAERPPVRYRRALGLAASVALLALTAAGCSSASSASSSAAGTGTGANAGTVDVSKVTLHIGDQAGWGRRRCSPRPG